jgi:hypothetical protein
MSFHKTDKAIFQQIIINKLYLPDVLIYIIKDYLYYSKDKSKHRYFQKSINNIIQTIEYGVEAYEIYGEYRWLTVCFGYETCGQIGDRIWKVLAQPAICIHCGTLRSHHNNLSGLCLYSYENDAEISMYIQNNHL